MRIMTKNILEDNSTIVMTNVDVNYPIKNIYSNMLEEIAQASTSSTLITISFAVDKIVNAIFFGYHNASNATFVFKNSAGAILNTVIFSMPDVYTKQYISELTAVRSVEITLTTSEIYLFVGNISCGKYTQLYNVRVPMTIEHIDTSVFSQTNGGQFLYRTGITVQSFNVDCDNIEDEYVSEFKEAYANVHKGKIFWMDRNEDLNTQILGAFDANYHTTRINTLTDLSFSFKEAK